MRRSQTSNPEKSRCAETSQTTRSAVRGLRYVIPTMTLWLFGVLHFAPPAKADDRESEADWKRQHALAEFAEHAEPFFSDYCYGCHADGASEGGVTLDDFATQPGRMRDTDLWWRILKNIRADIMPPHGEDRPSGKEVRQLGDWVARTVFQIDPQEPDPGHVVLRRLNRLEYRDTIHDLMGIHFESEVEFPPDDTGFGFDNIGEVLTLSPLLVEKFVAAAESIVSRSVPNVPYVIPTRKLDGSDFDSENGNDDARRMSFYRDARVGATLRDVKAGSYTISIDADVDGTFTFDPGQAIVSFQVDGRPLLEERFAWKADEDLEYRFDVDWGPGDHLLEFELVALVPESRKANRLVFDVNSVRIDGPHERENWVRPAGYDRFFPTRDDAESDEAYIRRTIEQFAFRAFRRPIDAQSLDRLVELALTSRGDGTLEAGVAQAVTAILASTRFLFRTETVDEATARNRFPLVDEFALASRLSYFLWSTMPDEETLELARRGELRKNLDTVIRRMLRDERSERFIRNFTGQWLQARDVTGVSIDTLAASGMRREYDELRARYNELRIKHKNTNVRDLPEYKEMKPRFDVLRQVRSLLDENLRRSMRRETEMSFAFVVREDRSVLEFLDCDYAFVDRRLASLYEIPDVNHDEMKRVALPADSPRGGLLTQATILAVTSNPTRTSPVKRGLFILDNILGTPAPPAPADIPDLEESAQKLAGNEPTLREVLELHRKQPLCNSCHSRFDPLGLGLENLNAFGAWRETDNSQPIEVSGQLITGETFSDVRELKTILRTSRRMDFYRCLTERLLTYALGRGLRYYDDITVEDIARQLETSGGRFSVLLNGVIRSAAFQRTRPTPSNERDEL